MLKYPIFLQDNENSCGAYCIKMLLSFYKRDDEIKNIKKCCRLTKEGVTVYGLIQVLKKYHLEAKAYQCEFKHLFEEVNCPAIVHLKQDDLYHYVILYKVKDGYFLVGDRGRQFRIRRCNAFPMFLSEFQKELRFCRVRLYEGNS